MNNGKNTDIGLFDADSFWSLDSLLPPSDKKKAAVPQSSEITLTDFEIAGDKTEGHGEIIPKRDTADFTQTNTFRSHYEPITKSVSSRPKNGSGENPSFDTWLEGRRTQEKEENAYGKRTVLEYFPNGKFIKKVTVSEETGLRIGGERFITDGRRLLGLSGKFNGNVPLESFYPQYSQLNTQQKACYIGFRTEVQSGRFPEVSRAYIYLYLYELINFPTPSAAERAETIASLISGYSGCDERLFSDMCNWLCDLCLIHQLEIPKSIYGDVLSRVLASTKFKDVFIDGQEQKNTPSLAFMLSASSYDYKKSRFYHDYSEYYDKYIPQAVSSELERLSEKDSRFSDVGAQSCVFSHESYFGAFCTGAMRRTITLEMRSATRDENVKRTVTDMVKYAENRLRSMLMIKPRLTVVYLPIPIREGIKGFFSELAPILPKKQEKIRRDNSEEVPEYEKYYEPIESGISEDTAREIEQQSWSITDKLVSAFDNEESTPSHSLEENVSTPYTTLISKENTHTSPTKINITDSPKSHDPNSASDDKDRFFTAALDALLRNDSEAFKALAKEKGMFPSAFADRINEIAYDEIGDSVIAETDGKYFIIEDYIEDASDIVSRSGNA